MPRMTAPTHSATMMIITTDAAATNHQLLELLVNTATECIIYVNRMIDICCQISQLIKAPIRIID